MVLKAVALPSGPSILNALSSSATATVLTPRNSLSKLVDWFKLSNGFYPQTAATIPSLLVGANNSTPTTFIPGSQINMLSSPLITRYGQWAFFAAGNGNFYKGPSGGGNAAQYAMFGFTHEGIGFAINSNRNSSYLVFADGQQLTASFVASGSTSAQVPAVIEYLFPTRSTRHITVLVNDNGTQGIYIGINDTIAALPASNAPSLGFITDSYGSSTSTFAGGGVGAFQVSMFARAGGFNASNGAFINSTTGGSGWLAEGTGVTASAGQERLPVISAYAPDAIVFALGINDPFGSSAITFTGTLSNSTGAQLTGAWVFKSGSYNVTFSNGNTIPVTFTANSINVSWSAASPQTATANATVNVDLQGNVAACAAAARAANPSAVIVCLGPWAPNGTASGLSGNNSTNKAAAIKAGLAAGDPSGPWIFLDNINGAWNTSAGKSGLIGNNPWQTGDGGAIVFTAPLVAATSGTITPVWPGGNVSRTIVFSDGSTRAGTFTQGSGNVTWTGGAVTATINAGAYNTTQGNSVFDIVYDGANPTHPTQPGANMLSQLLYDGFSQAIQTGF